MCPLIVFVPQTVKFYVTSVVNIQSYCSLLTNLRGSQCTIRKLKLLVLFKSDVVHCLAHLLHIREIVYPNRGISCFPSSFLANSGTVNIPGPRLSTYRTLKYIINRSSYNWHYITRTLDRVSIKERIIYLHILFLSWIAKKCSIICS
jgi:hypothetical protein